MTTKKTAGAALQGAIDTGLAKSAEARRWEASTFTDDELTVIHASITRQPPPRKAPADLRDKTIAAALKAGLSVSDAKAVLKKAMAPTGGTTATRAPVSPERKPAPDRGGGKGPAQKSAPAKAPAKKLKSIEGGQTKTEIIRAAISGKGATLEHLMKITGWQAHSVRGAIATMQTQGGDSINSTKEDGQRHYQLVIPGGPKAAPKQKAAAASVKRGARTTKKAPAKAKRR